MLLSIEHNLARTLDYEDLIDTFSKENARKKVLKSSFKGIFSTLWSTSLLFLVFLLFENDNVIGAPRYNFVLGPTNSLGSPACFVTHFCAQAVFQVPFSNTFPTQEKDRILNIFRARYTREC